MIGRFFKRRLGETSKSGAGHRDEHDEVEERLEGVYDPGNLRRTGKVLLVALFNAVEVLRTVTTPGTPGSAS